MALLGRGSKKDYPMLASEVKAANVKILCKFVADVAPQYDNGSTHDRHVTCCMWALAEWIRCLDEGGAWFESTLKSECVAA
eukprot:1154726-Pyramimonas_sp.AAC.1